MRKPIVMPDLGEVSAVLSLWYARPGDQVYSGDRLVEILLEGATFDLSAPGTGHFCEKLAWPNDPLVPGQILGFLEEETME